MLASTKCSVEKIGEIIEKPAVVCSFFITILINLAAYQFTSVGATLKLVIIDHVAISLLVLLVLNAVGYFWFEESWFGKNDPRIISTFDGPMDIEIEEKEMIKLLQKVHEEANVKVKKTSRKP